MAADGRTAVDGIMAADGRTAVYGLTQEAADGKTAVDGITQEEGVEKVAAKEVREAKAETSHTKLLRNSAFAQDV